MSSRLVLIVPGFPKLSETFIVSKFLGLLERGWDVHVVCGGSEEAQFRHFLKLEKHPEARRRTKVAWPHRPRWLAGLLMPFAFSHCLWSNPLGTWRYLCRGARRFGWGVLRQLYLDAPTVALSPDLVHFEFGALSVGRLHLKELLLAKCVVSFRGYDLHFVGLEDPDHYSEVWEHVDGVHCLGSALWDRARQRGCPPSVPHALISPAVDCDYFRAPSRQRFEPAGNGETPLRVLMVGRLVWSKGYEYALHALRILRENGVSFECRVIGGGKSRDCVAFCRHQMGLKHQVTFLGDKSREVVREQMAWADVFLHSAVQEGFCNAVIEAQAMGLPVVCSDAGGLPENVADGGTGFVVPRRDPEALAAKLAILARDRELRLRMGTAGRQRVLANFQIADQIAGFEELYRATLNGEALSPQGTAVSGPLPVVSGQSCVVLNNVRS